MILFLLLFSGLWSYELAIASQFRDEAPYLAEWIEYHRLMGVDHFWLYNNSSQDEWEEIIEPYIHLGLVEVIDWPSSPLSFQEYHMRAIRDALKRGNGVAKWIALIDIDEFLVPMKESTVTAVLEKHFADADAIYANWKMFGTGGLYLLPGECILNKLVACSLRAHSRNVVGKSIVRPEWADPDASWYEHYVALRPGTSGYFNGSGRQMFFDGTTLLSVTQHEDTYLRINHYNLRDENFYQNNRLARARNKIYGELKLFEEHHVSFSLDQDTTIIDLLKNSHPEAYFTFWQVNP